MAEQKATNITWHAGSVARADRERLLKQRGVTLWMTGLSGSGKSTIAVIVEQLLTQRGRLTYRLDGDNVRHGLNKNVGFSADDRAENIRRIGEVAKLFTDAGVITIASFISPYRRDRDAIRASMTPGDFVEVFINTPLDVAESRDPKGLYKKARAAVAQGKGLNFTGIDDPYEHPEQAEIEVDTTASSPERAAEQIVSYLQDRGYLGPRVSAQPAALDAVFLNLSAWRHLPSYQLERRFDVFLTPYLRRIVEAHVNVALHPVIVPEMPLKQERTKLTDKADYALFSADGRAAFLIELKTDCGSIRPEQTKYLDRCCSNPWKQTLQDLVEVARTSRQWRKYGHLLALLESAGQLKLHPDFRRAFEPRSTLRLRPEWVKVVTEVQTVQTIYIMPKAQDDLRCISFADVRATLTVINDDLTPHLTRALDAWERAAGIDCPP